MKPKKILLIILLLIIAAGAVYAGVWLNTNKRNGASESISQPTQEKKAAVSKIHQKDKQAKIMICLYKDALVYTSDSRAIDGPFVVYDANGDVRYTQGSGMAEHPTTNLPKDFKQTDLTECVVVYDNGYGGSTDDKIINLYGI